LPTTLQALSLAARLRGDMTEADLLTRAAALARTHHVRNDRDVGSRLPGSAADEPAVRRLRALSHAGSWVALESALADLPSDLRLLIDSEALTLEQLAALHTATAATSVADIADLVRREQLRDVPGLTRSIEDGVAKRLPHLRVNVRRIPLGRATALVEPLLERLRLLPDVAWADPIGSLRRGHELVGDIEVVASTDRPDDVFAALARELEITGYRHRSRRRHYFMIDGTQVGVRCDPVAVAGATMVILTGAHTHVDQLHARARQRGWSLTPDGLALNHGDVDPAGDSRWPR
jgi:DNA polymerase (family 10)